MGANDGDVKYYTTALQLADQNGYSAGLAKAGLSPDWVVLGDYDIKREIIAGRGSANFDLKFTGFPIKNSTMVVPNPQDIVTKGIGSIPALQASIQATMMDIMLGAWQNGSTSDPAQVYSVPVFMLMEAVNSMAQAKQLAEQEKQEEEEQEKNFIMLIVSVVLMVSSARKYYFPSTFLSNLASPVANGNNVVRTSHWRGSRSSSRICQPRARPCACG